MTFRDGSAEKFWESAMEKLGNNNLQMYDILTPLGKKHQNLMNFLFYNVFPFKEDPNQEYADNTSTRQDAASPCIIFKAIKN